MSLFLAAIVSGVALGVLLGLLGFGIVLLYKSTGVANFAQGTIGTAGAFLVYKIAGATGAGPVLALVLGLVAAVPLSVLLYLSVFRVNDEAGHFNLTIRTLGVQMLLLALIHMSWAKGQPFAFTGLFPATAALRLGDTTISWTTVGTAVTATVMTGLFMALFRFTDIGLQLIAVSERPDAARLLGVRTRRMVVIAFVFAAVVATMVGVLLAPAALLSSDMMEPYTLLAFTAVVIGGLTSLPGVFVGGVIVGVVNNLAALYLANDIGILVIFVVLLIVLRLRPHGIFGSVVAERL